MRSVSSVEAGENLKNTVSSVEAGEDLKNTVFSMLNCVHLNVGVLIFPDVETCKQLLPSLLKLDPELYAKTEQMQKSIEIARELKVGDLNSSIAYAWKFTVKLQEDHGEALLTQSSSGKLLIVLTMNQLEPSLVKLYWVFYVMSYYLNPKHFFFFSQGLKFQQKNIKNLIDSCEPKFVAGSYGTVTHKSEHAIWKNPFVNFNVFEVDFDYMYLKLIDNYIGLCSLTPYLFVCYKWSSIADNSFASLVRLFKPLVAPHKMSWSDTYIYFKCPFSILDEELAANVWYSKDSIKFGKVVKSEHKLEMKLDYKAKAIMHQSHDLATDISKRAAILNNNWMWMVRFCNTRTFARYSSCIQTSRMIGTLLNVVIAFALSLLLGVVFTVSIVGIQVRTTQEILSFFECSLEVTDVILLIYKTLYTLLMISTAIWSLSVPIEWSEVSKTWKSITWINLLNTVVVAAGWAINLFNQSFVKMRLLGLVGIVFIIVFMCCMSIFRELKANKDIEEGSDVTPKRFFQVVLREGSEKLWKYVGYLFFLPTYTNTVWIYAALNPFHHNLNSLPFYFGKPYTSSDKYKPVKLVSSFSLKRAMLLIVLITANIGITGVYEDKGKRGQPLFFMYALFCIAALSPALAWICGLVNYCLCYDTRASKAESIESIGSEQERLNSYP